MTKGRWMRILLVLISILILIGVVFMRCTPNRLTAEGGLINVVLSDGKTQIVEFDNLSLVPGEECEYIVTLEHALNGQCDVTFDFREIEEKTLKYFIRVKMIADGEILCDEILADMFEKENIVLPVDFAENKNTKLKIVYFMPFEVGNEAKNAETIFELRITTKNK